MGRRAYRERDEAIVSVLRAASASMLAKEIVDALRGSFPNVPLSVSPEATVRQVLLRLERDGRVSRQRSDGSDGWMA